ncbi:hypothetical protein [Cysteiniphilum sp. QT6929]|uniref:hypothetical protein n=1 Tax=Cysteiniphilum sp. QT6929 TaxID=2975055 RepID=UPI0024B34E20|nr:hypothetical protein [Cysteiniphilum sp. QT6929]WHN66502.1 hypothetical protein NYP54_04545 [Cysteiniphilum sp. QT6929]
MKINKYKLICIFLVVVYSPWVYASGEECPFISSWENDSQFTLTVTKGGAWGDQKLSAPVGTIFTPEFVYNYMLFNYLILDIKTAQGDYLGTASISVKTDGSGNQYLFDNNGYLTFKYDASKSHYDQDCWQDRRYFEISINSTPPIITNKGWQNGMGNQEDKVVAGDSFWVQDYGTNDLGRWQVSNDAVYQTTEVNQYGTQGSRAYPIGINQDGVTIGNGIGSAKDGLWQIDVKVGSNGAGDFCETFYLAERKNMIPGPQNYLDGSGGAQGGIGREIDVLETKWKPTGPQINLPTGGNSGWNPNAIQGLQLGTWAENGGAPATEFSTFGVLIRDQNLWIYAYKTDGSFWYSTDAVPLTNTAYNQEGDFVPYIGTWGSGSEVIKTGYKNFIYLKADDPRIVGKNPKDNPDAFGPALLKPAAK